MLNYSLHISLDNEENYFEVEPENGVKHGEEMVDRMPSWRKTWQPFMIRNKPYNYKQSALNGFRLYDIIVNDPNYTPTTKYIVRFTLGTQVVKGYFGKVDCKINEDHSLIQIDAATLDQYTEFLENYETKVNVFGTSNVVRNGDFENWFDGLPIGFESSTGIARGILLDKYCAKLGSYNYIDGGLPPYYLPTMSILTQTVAGLREGAQSQLSFYYRVVGNLTENVDLEYSLTISNDTDTYQYTDQDSWILSSGKQEIKYATNKVPLPTDSVDSFSYFNKTISAFPISGDVEIRLYYKAPVLFYYSEADFSHLYVTSLEFATSDINYMSVDVSLLDNKFKEYKLESIKREDGSFYPEFFRVGIREKDYPNIDDYFDDDGSPNETLLADGKFGPSDENGQQEYITDLMNKFADDPNSSFFLGEICELSIYKDNNTYTQFFKKYRSLKASAKFAREEIWTQNDNNGESVKPDGGGWANINITEDKKGYTKWGRTPYNGAGNWVKYPKDTSGGSEYEWGWSEKSTSIKQYPAGDNSETIESAVDFRDVCRKIYRGTHNSLLSKEVYSAFFWNDSPFMDFLELQNGENYYRMNRKNGNYLNQIAAVHTSDLKTVYNPDKENTDLKVSFKDFFEDLKVKWPSLIWWIDEDYNLHIEHLRFTDRFLVFTDIINITGYNYVGDYKEYDFNPDELYGNIIREELNSSYKDFKRSEMIFDKIVTNKRNRDLKQELATKVICTDVQHAIEYRDELENGMLLVNYIDDGTSKTIRYGKGIITKKEVPNGLLSTPSLLRNFGNYEGTWSRGYIDGDIVNFKFTKKCRNGKQIKLKGIIEDHYLLTGLGMANIIEKEYDYDNETTTITPVYRHEDYYFVADNNEFLQFERDLNEEFDYYHGLPIGYDKLIV
ncbi:hypothetical protein [Sunxiuqinia indica]|uniref:hypothetical protein n=1 Tax=Sunxiuqinia indica TaxID=2692584 RepID=UPI00135A4648|nr:hypothetical protein [Sunxiuqinia indica]